MRVPGLLQSFRALLLLLGSGLSQPAFAQGEADVGEGEPPAEAQVPRSESDPSERSPDEGGADAPEEPGPEPPAEGTQASPTPPGRPGIDALEHKGTEQVVEHGSTDESVDQPPAEEVGTSTDPRDPQPASTLDSELEGADLTGSPPPPPEDPPGAGEPAPAGKEHRDPPDYDGRPSPPPSAGDVLIWVPRILLFPAYLVMEYVVRRPIVWGVTQVEKWKVGEHLEEALTWDEGRGSLYPMINFDFGIRPHIGLVAQWEEFAPRHDVYLAGFVGPGDLWAGAFQLDQRLFRDESATLSYLASYVRRPDAVYFGINDQPSPCQVSRQGCRYRTAIAEGHATLTAFEDYLSGVEFDVMLRQARFSTEETDLPPISQAEADSLAGFDEGYLLFRPRLHLMLDTRANDIDFTKGTGIRLEGSGSANLDLQNASSRWFRFGFEAAGFYDFGTGQIVGARLYAETIANISHDEDSGGARPEVPFHELIQLGGSDRLRGFLRGRLRGNHAWTATLEYRYPIMWALDAGMFSSIGNVYESFSDFDIRRNYLNYGFTFRVKRDRGAAFESVIGFGSNRLDSASFDAFDQFRFTVGFNPGF